jgi:hypothetical protein
MNSSKLSEKNSNNDLFEDFLKLSKFKLKESEDLLKKFSSDNLKGIFCIHTNNSNKPGIIVDDLGASTSYAFDSKIKSLVIKPMIVDTTCLDNSENSFLNNCVEPESKDLQGKQTQGKFVPICHHCGIIGQLDQTVIC